MTSSVALFTSFLAVSVAGVAARQNAIDGQPFSILSATKDSLKSSPSEYINMKGIGGWSRHRNYQLLSRRLNCEYKIPELQRTGIDQKPAKIADMTAYIFHEP